MHPGIFAT